MRFVIATGSRPFRPKDVDFTHPRIFDSDTLLSLDRTPASIAIYGAGVVGCEYASMWRNMQSRVHADQHARQTAGLSGRRDHRRAELSSFGKRRAHSAQAKNTSASSRPIAASCCTCAAARKSAPTSCCGPTAAPGNTDDLGLENVGIVPNHRGQIDVNEHYQTVAAAHLRRGRRGRLSVAGQRFVRSGPLCRQPLLRRPQSSPGARTFPRASTPAPKSRRSARPSGN